MGNIQVQPVRGNKVKTVKVNARHKRQKTTKTKQEVTSHRDGDWKTPRTQERREKPKVKELNRNKTKDETKRKDTNQHNPKLTAV